MSAAAQTARDRARQRANEVRSARADLKRRIAADQIDLPGLLEAVGPRSLAEQTMGGMRVVELVRAVPGIGEVTAERILQDSRIYARQRVDELTPKLRRGLAARIRKEVEG